MQLVKFQQFSEKVVLEKYDSNKIKVVGKQAKRETGPIVYFKEVDSDIF